jgi:hypothetical protein
LVLVLGVSFDRWDGPPPKFGWNMCPSDWTSAITTRGAGLTFPEGGIGCGVIQVFSVFATAWCFPIETEAGIRTFV